MSKDRCTVYYTHGRIKPKVIFFSWLSIILQAFCAALLVPTLQPIFLLLLLLLWTPLSLCLLFRKTKTIFFGDFPNIILLGELLYLTRSKSIDRSWRNLNSFSRITLRAGKLNNLVHLHILYNIYVSNGHQLGSWAGTSLCVCATLQLYKCVIHSSCIYYHRRHIYFWSIAIHNEL